MSDEWKRMSFSELKRQRVAVIRQAYFGLTGQNEGSPARKADLLYEIQELMRNEARLAASAARDKAARAVMKARERQREEFHAENREAQRRNNAIFDDMPPVPLWGEGVQP